MPEARMIRPFAALGDELLVAEFDGPVALPPSRKTNRCSARSPLRDSLSGSSGRTRLLVHDEPGTVRLSALTTAAERS
jgi:hypothetical protein